MNREVHYIFSIQTKDYLKSAWERGRQIYLIIRRITQCWADSSRNINEAVAKRELSQRSTTNKLFDQESNESQQLWAEPTFHLSATRYT